MASGGGLIRDRRVDFQAFTLHMNLSLQVTMQGYSLCCTDYTWRDSSMDRQFNRPIWIELDTLMLIRILESRA